MLLSLLMLAYVICSPNQCGLLLNIDMGQLDSNFELKYSHTYGYASEESEINDLYKNYRGFIAIVVGMSKSNNNDNVAAIDYVDNIFKKQGSISGQTAQLSPLDRAAHSCTGAIIYWYYGDYSFGFSPAININIDSEWMDNTGMGSDDRRISWPVNGSRTGRRFGKIKACVNCYYGYNGNDYYKRVYVSPCANFKTPCDQCKTGYYFVGAKCELCYSNCASCSSTAMSSCNTCIANYNIFTSAPNYCVRTFNCSKGCDKCVDLSNCISPKMQYYLAAIPGVPAACHSSCQTCTSPAQESCISCMSNFNFIFTVDSKSYCLNSTNGCSIGCSKCNEYTIPHCFECMPSYYHAIATSPFSCMPCNKTCLTCNNSSTCLTCISGYYLNPAYSCLPCHLSCFNCSGSTYNDCYSCSAGFTYDNSMNLCTKSLGCTTNCHTCVGSKSNECVECNNYYYTPTTPGSCAACHNSCLKCSGAESKLCILCRNSSFSYDSYLANTVSYCTTQSGCSANCHKCIWTADTDCTECSTGYYHSSLFLKCNKCPTGCTICFYSSPVVLCSACQDGYFLNTSQKCEVCNVICTKCTDRYNDTCSECISIQYMALASTICDCIDQYKYDVAKGECYKPCKTGYNYTRNPSMECVEICGDGLNFKEYQCDDGNKISGDGCNSTCYYEDNFFCKYSSVTLKDTCTPMQYQITFPTSNSKTFILHYNFDPLNLNELIQNLNVSIMPSNKSAPYLLAIGSVAKLNSSSIIIKVNITENIYSNDTLVIHSIFPTSTATNYTINNYNISALLSKVCESKCNPEVTTEVSAQQTATNAVSTSFTIASSLINGMNLGKLSNKLLCGQLGR